MSSPVSALRRLDAWLLAAAPAERLAAFRVLTGGFAVVYVAVRAPALWALTRRPPSRFEGVGVLALLDDPPGRGLVAVVLAATVVSGLAFVAGIAYRVAAPLFASLLLLVTTYHSSFGQLLHFENLFVLHVIVLAASPAADAWSIRVRETPAPPASMRYGWPLRLAAIVTVATYVVAGIAKLRITGVDWVVGDTLRNHIAYSNARAELLGGIRPPLARPAVDWTGLLPWLAGASLAIELGAPLALAGRPLRWVWATGVVVMHLGIAALLAVFFPYHALGFALVPLFAIERPARRLLGRGGAGRRWSILGPVGG